jgi:hypothetical protein
MRFPQAFQRPTIWHVLALGFALPAGLTLAVLIPKNNEAAATSRFIITLATLTGATAGLLLLRLSLRRYRETRRMLRYGPASSAVRDTLKYLQHEEALARRGQTLALIASLTFVTLFVASHWPQAQFLSAYTLTFKIGALASLALMPLLALRNRGHMVNTIYLRRYMKQQVDHIGYRPHIRPPYDPAQTVANNILGSLCLQIGGHVFTFADLVMNVLLLGQIGAGKTMILNFFLEHLIASSAKDPLPIMLLVLDAKGDFLDKCEILATRYQRSTDLVVLDPKAWGEHGGTRRSIAYNFLDNDDDALEVASRFIAVLKMLGLETGSEGSFFIDSAKTAIRHGIVLVRAAALTPAPSIIMVYRLFQEGEEETPLYHQVIEAIGKRFPGELSTQILDAIQFFEKEWGPMTERQKSGLRGTLTQLLDEFTLEPYCEMFTAPSTLSMDEMIDSGAIVNVHMPMDMGERMSRVVTTLFKLDFQRKILQRRGKQRPSAMFCDEFQTIYTTGDGHGDSEFMERSRESLHATIYASQNLQAFLKRTRNSHDVKNFLGNTAVKIFLRNSEEETNRWASGLFGTRPEIVISASEQAAFNGGWSKRRHTSYSRSIKNMPRVAPEAFTRLAIPVRGDPNAREAESMIHLGSRGEVEHLNLFWPIHPIE